MDFTIRLRAEGTAETRAQAEAVKAVRTELESTIAVAKAAGISPKAAFNAANEARKKAATDSSSASKNAEKAITDRRKQADREDKELERASKRAIAAIIRDEKEQAKAKEKAKKDAEKAAKKADEDAALKIDPSRRKKSAVEQARESVSKKKDQALAERIDPSLKELSKTEKAIKSKFTDPLKIGVAGAAIAAGAALGGIAYKLAPLAMGYMGMARLSMISQQASFNMRRLFVGTNPRPLLDALQRTGQLLDPRTFTGDRLGALLRRTADSTFALLAKAEPYARLFFKGMLLGALQVENAWLRLRIAIQPALNLLPAGVGHMTAITAGALAVKGAFALMGVGVALGAVKAAGALLSFGTAAIAATGPLIPLVAAVAVLVSAYQDLKEVQDEWGETSWDHVKTEAKEFFGIISEGEAKAEKKQIGDAYEKKYGLGKYGRGPMSIDSLRGPTPAAPVPKVADKAAAPAGANIGKQLGLGVVAGMKDTQAKVEAGGRDLVLAAEGGAKAAAIIRSPSQKWRKEIGRNLGEGAALGLEDSAGRIEEAARAAVPASPVAGGVGGRRGGIVIESIGPFYGMPSGGEQQVRRWVFDAIDDAAERIGALA